MRRALLIICCLFPLFSLAKERIWKAEEVPIPYLVDSTQYVSNPDGVLSAAATDSINMALALLRQKTGVQSVVVVVKRIEGADPYTFGMKIGRKYGVGDKKKRTGLIIVLSTEDRCYQILTGNGLEGALPDATCRMIEIHHMDPYLKQGQWDKAMTQCVKAVCKQLEGDPSLNAKSDESPFPSSSPLLLLILVALIALFVWVMTDAAKIRCPRCGRKDMMVSDRRLIRRDGPYDYYELTYRCRKCDYQQKEIVREHHQDGGSMAAGMAAGALFGSLMGRGRGGFGGGWSGGDFGGGSFGGGGAGGRF